MAATAFPQLYSVPSENSVVNLFFAFDFRLSTVNCVYCGRAR